VKSIAKRCVLLLFRDLAMLCVYAPLQLILAVIFLYNILSWSSLIGMLVLVLTLPVPGLLARLLNTVQGELMAATDARVGEITEAMGAVRMLKMFGWEVKSKERINEKREKELKISRKKQIISQVSLA
jgi:ABC-type transport system involved in cytochrome bd biosynthesis fused ATPase/permease subunit